MEDVEFLHLLKMVEVVMLRVLHLENWKSFHEPVDFTMIAGKGTRHNETLARNGKHDGRILPIAAIYGANAAGKSALLDAVHLLQQLVSEARAASALQSTQALRGGRAHSTRC